ncbi:MAG: DUF4214 domain-containing protein [Actinomycetota bacterium]
MPAETADPLRGLRYVRALPALLTAVLAALVALFILPGSPVSAQESSGGVTVRQITFPVAADRVDDLRWTDTFGAPRSGGRSHIGVDMLGDKMIPLVAARSGTVTWGRFSNSRGSLIRFRDAEGWEYQYIHLNNDTPGTDDGAATCTQAFSERLCGALRSDGTFERGFAITEGEVIGYLGDGGNAEWTAPHLHFEIYKPGGLPINPTASVDAAADRARAGVGGSEPEAAEPGEDGFVDHVWYRIHGRYPTSEERDAFEKAADDDVWRAVAAELDADTSAAAVDRLYLSVFGRYPDAEGLQYWIRTRANGNDLHDIAEWFAQSEEYRTRFDGPDITQFLDQLYRNVLGREPDAAGRSYWIRLMADGTVDRGSIVLYFSESEELRASTWDRAELVALRQVTDGGVPTQPEVAQWRSARASRTIAEAAATIYGD